MPAFYRLDFRLPYGFFPPDQLAARKESLASRVTGKELLSRTVSGKEIQVPVAEGDVALPLAMEGYRGCVAKTGDAYFAQTADIPDAMLERSGLVKGFGEVRNPETGSFDRIAIDDERMKQGARTVWVGAAEAGKPVADMSPAAKRIASGFVLTYGNKELAADLVSQAMATME